AELRNLFPSAWSAAFITTGSWHAVVQYDESTGLNLVVSVAIETRRDTAVFGQSSSADAGHGGAPSRTLTKPHLTPRGPAPAAWLESLGSGVSAGMHL